MSNIQLKWYLQIDTRRDLIRWKNLIDFRYSKMMHRPTIRAIILLRQTAVKSTFNSPSVYQTRKLIQLKTIEHITGQTRNISGKHVPLVKFVSLSCLLLWSAHCLLFPTSRIPGSKSLGIVLTFQQNRETPLNNSRTL